MLTAKQFTDALARRLKTARKIDVRQSEGLKPLPAAERDALAATLKAYLGTKPSAEMLRRLSYPRYLQLYWQYAAEKESDIFNGEISLNNIGVALLEKDFSFVDYGKHPELTVLDTYRVLDDHPHIGDGNMAAVTLNEEFTDVDLHYLEMFKPYRLKLTLEEYHQCLTVTLGYTHWQFLFCEGLDASSHDYMQTTYRAKLTKDLRTLWPDDDLKEFFALVDRAG